MMKTMMMQWEQVYHKTEWQQNYVLSNCSSHSVSIALSIYIRQAKYVRGKDADGQHDTLGWPAGSDTSRLDLIAGCRAFDKTGYFCTVILWLGKTMKHFFYSRPYSYNNPLCKTKFVLQSALIKMPAAICTFLQDCWSNLHFSKTLHQKSSLFTFTFNSNTYVYMSQKTTCQSIDLTGAVCTVSPKPLVHKLFTLSHSSSVRLFFK
jgi:hypothetical protein